MTDNPVHTERGLAAYHAAFSALSGRYHGATHTISKGIAQILSDRDCLPELARSADARRPLVEAVTAAAVRDGVRGGAEHARPLIDAAVAAAAKAMLDADAPGEPTGHAFLVVEDRQIGWAGLDGVRADEYARNVGGVVVRVPIVADYRPAGEGDLR